MHNRSGEFALQKMTAWHIGSDVCHLLGGFVGWGIVLLQLSLVCPFASLLKQLIAL